MKFYDDLEKLKIKYKNKIETLEEKKGYFVGKKFDKILDEIYDLNISLEKITKCENWLEYDSSSKYKVTVTIVK